MVNKKKARKPWTKSKWEVFSMAMIGVVILFIFAYLPMCGLVLAFKEGNGYLNITKAIFDSDWAGFDNFKELCAGLLQGYGHEHPPHCPYPQGFGCDQSPGGGPHRAAGADLL